MTEQEVKKCPGCKKTKPITEFGKNSFNPSLRRRHCKECIANSREQLKPKLCPATERERISSFRDLKDASLREKFGITIEQYELMSSKQDHLCAICKRPCTSGRRLAVNHNHTTEQIRGLLCTKCNLGIGYFNDSADILKAAASYLERYATT